ncbi:MAG: hypothetical protein GXP49_18575 [Deltaproteobacteria bacterium]|nr:hypothetical protein [Deltaproteobacteria bacterium]
MVGHILKTDLLLFSIMGIVSAFLPSCKSATEENPDADIADADAGGEKLSICEEELAKWTRIWKVARQKSGLEDRTPANDLMDVWGKSADDLYAVGFSGTILHFDGTSWKKMESGTTEDLMGVWGYKLEDQENNQTRTEVFAVGTKGTILRYDGKAWALMKVISDPDPDKPRPVVVVDNLHDVWGIKPAGMDPQRQHPTVIAVGAEGVIVRYEAEEDLFKEMRRRDEEKYFDDVEQVEKTRIAYNRFTSERLGGVFGVNPNRFVAVGNNGTILQYNGTTWTKFTITGFVKHLNGVWGRSGGEVFAVGLDGTVVRGSIGGNWRTLNLNPKPPPVYLRSVWAFYQSKCGVPKEVPDAGSIPQDTSWVVFVGWDGALLLAHNGHVCELPDFPGTRLEGIWGIAPRSEAQRSDDAGNVTCDPVNVFVVGVNGAIYNLLDENERDL